MEKHCELTIVTLERQINELSGPVFSNESANVEGTA